MQEEPRPEEEHPPADPARVERGLRSLYWTFGWKVLAGTAVIASLWFIPLPSKWLAIPFLLVGGWLILANLSAIAFLSRVHNAYKHGPEDETPLEVQERGERVLHYTGYVLLFATMLVMIPLGRMVENIVEQGRWLMIFGGLGAALAALVLWWAKGRFPLYFRNNEKRAASVLGLVLGSVGLFILVPAWIDRDSAKGRSELRRFVLKDGGENIKTGSKYLHLYHPGQHQTTFRIQVRGKELAAAKGKDSVEVRVGSGDLGFTHVLEVVVGTGTR